MDTSKGSYLMKKIIKRAAAVICGAALTATMTLSAFALPSPSVSGFVKGVQSAVDANGNAVNIIVQLVADAKFDAAGAGQRIVPNGGKNTSEYDKHTWTFRQESQTLCYAAAQAGAH